MRVLFTILFIFSFSPALFSQMKDPFLYGRAEMDKGRWGEAIGIFTSELESGNGSADLLMNLGRCHYRVGDYRSAIHYFLLADNKKKNAASFWLAKSYAMAGDNDSAMVFLRTNLSSEYKIAQSTIKLDTDFIKLEGTRAWRDLWNKDWYDEYESLLAEINYLTGEKKYIETLDLIDQNLSKYSHRHRIFAARGEIFLDLKNFNSAVTAYTRAIEINGTQPDYYISRSKAYSNLGKYNLAVSDLIKALNLEPDNFPLYIERSLLYDHLSNFNLALDDITFYLTYFPDDIQATFIKGQIYYDQGSYLKAMELFNKCLLSDQSKPEFFAARGNAYLKTNTYKFAIQDYGMALDLDPKNPDTYLNRGMARFQYNNKKGACNDWEKAARLGSAKAVEMLNNHCQR